ncbi:glycogen/starch/alpha-glucan phosphorylase [Desulforhopalus vacuolatus]|uniref:glycogen/starch/alpha-glucan phosphorylase n=1 Tax=Desulforhopalus vacuolatus TaxID=40414 RepID=UPI001964A4CB|nr:glycogen/starch/alpha-glucan phosphorylase [Desulforhopalus vacuolatus]MBM9519543.1 glycogen/starch/alpha-glucan phosphorylase [Desulforhopalus vacuolatus]
MAPTKAFLEAENEIEENRPEAGSRENVERLKKSVLHHLLSFQGRDPERSGEEDVYRALAYTMRDLMVEKWIETQKAFYAKEQKRVYYLSLEFLIGRSLRTAVTNLGLYQDVQKAVTELGFKFDDLRNEEEDAALGNGGLGRLAACFMDSIATLQVPGFGYGIRYEYGLFYQKLIDGYQREIPDNWLENGSPWEFDRSVPRFPVQFFGDVLSYQDDDGSYRAKWINTQKVMARASDILVPGYKNDFVLNLRLWSAHSSRDLNLAEFSRGDYIGAVQEKVHSETISKVLYPPDHNYAGQELRLKQQYFFVAATFQDIMRRFTKRCVNFDQFPDEVAVQLNDTHPSIAIPELMRLLLDIEGLSWEQAWKITVNTFAYTNHTLMPEALERWSVDMMGRVLPRHLQIIYEINVRFLKEVSERYPDDTARLKKLSIIEEGNPQMVRMAHLAIIGSHSVNGVAKLHSELLKERLFPEFNEFFPGRFNNKTNGITPRRWLLDVNHELSLLISEKIGSDWVTNLDQLRGLEVYADDPGFGEAWKQVKLYKKKQLARYIYDEVGVKVDPTAMFDIQVKRIHEYKRQLLAGIHLVHLYQRIVRGEAEGQAPRVAIFAGKAAPSYWRAKLIIKFINSIGDVINSDPRVGDRLKVVFLPNYNVSQAEIIMPAADLSEQISTAGTEASGTGNMKFSLNGALTIGTLDGANIEIREEVGDENIFIFGMTAEEVAFEKKNPSRTPEQVCSKNKGISDVINCIREGAFSNGDTELFKPLVDSLMDPHDPYLLMLDFESYLECQKKVSTAFLKQRVWTKMSILNVARMGKFSADRTIREYAEDIWKVKTK